MVKRWSLVLCALALAAGGLWASGNRDAPRGAGASDATTGPADPFGRYTNPISITVSTRFFATEKLPEGDTPQSNQYTRHIMDTLNIEVKSAWAAADGKDYDQRVSLAIASNDLPDAIVMNAQQFRQAAKAGEIQDLTDVYAGYAYGRIKEMVDSSKGIAMKAASYGARMMGLPSLNVPEDSYHLTWLRKDWLDKLGLSVPNTLDQLEAVAKAFVERDPDGNGKPDTIGITGPQNGARIAADFLSPTNNYFGLDPVFAVYGAYPGFWLRGSDGKAVYGSILPQTRSALARLRQMYATGLLDQQTGVRKDSVEPIVSGQSGIFFGNWWHGYYPLPDALTNNPNANWQAYAIPRDANDVYNTHMGTPCNTFLVVRKGYEHPEAAIRIVNVNVRDESTFDTAKGSALNEVLRLAMASYVETDVTLDALYGIMAGSRKPESYAAPEYDIYKLLKQDAQAILKVKKAPYDRFDIQTWDRQADPNQFNRLYSLLVGAAAVKNPAVKRNEVFSLIYTQTKTMESRWSNLKQMEDETFLKIILGFSPLEAFDKFVADWKAQGGDQITAEVDAEASN
jgi:putative aldouronate transport system substrate-binding protein